MARPKVSAKFLGDIPAVHDDQPSGGRGANHHIIKPKRIHIQMNFTILTGPSKQCKRGFPSADPHHHLPLKLTHPLDWVEVQGNHPYLTGAKVKLHVLRCQTNSFIHQVLIHTADKRNWGDDLTPTLQSHLHLMVFVNTSHPELGEVVQYIHPWYYPFPGDREVQCVDPI